MMEGKRDNADHKLDKDKHLITLDLAIYDELQWQKIMLDVEKGKVFAEAAKKSNDTKL